MWDLMVANGNVEMKNEKGLFPCIINEYIYG